MNAMLEPQGVGDARNVLRVRDLHWVVNGRHVLQSIDLLARPGRVLVLIGPNGAGKSSLLGLMAGLQRPSLGEACLDGRALHRWGAHALAQRRAMLSQQVRLGFAFGVDEVVMLGRSPHRLHDAGERDVAVVETVLRVAGVGHLRGRNYLELSGGEQQRVQWARVLAQVWDRREPPAWLLLDEPEAGLDIAHQHELLRVARQMAGQGHGVIAVLHDLNLAAQYGDDIALLANGRLVRHGAPSQVLEPEVISRVYGIAMRRSVAADGEWFLHPGR